MQLGFAEIPRLKAEQLFGYKANNYKQEREYD
jgi:hypothetical protein